MNPTIIESVATSQSHAAAYAAALPTLNDPSADQALKNYLLMLVGMRANAEWRKANRFP